ncbi:hypothetical protein VHEMI04245 [[Torrubiella] hemipterigena]|uniref:Uncharacterized protein n=1 Tax=[Torrubiella] hemipterigena TaxID=1531966 RepID=A0A0A1T0P7_9HYPO|nr:hypothetical protein VHEMI04245 [[Torrubiella] hemipterigena]
MCGPETCDRPRGGALVALNPPVSNRASPASFSGDLTFHTPGSPSSQQATHVRLVPSSVETLRDWSNLNVVIHSTGDMTKDTKDCGRFREISFASCEAVNDSGVYELLLNRPLSLEVGGDGIIGRRVSVCSRPRPSNDDIVMAEGIVGFNIAPPTRPSL